MTFFYRWVPKTAASDAIKRGLRSHNDSALWIFRLGTNFHQPRRGVSKDRVLIAYELDAKTAASLDSGIIDFESPDFKGESAHPRLNIVKSNEPGVYGLGEMRQVMATKGLVSTKYASLDKVAAALGKNRREITESNKPPTGWPKD